MIAITASLLITISCYERPNVDSLWNKDFRSAQEIADTYNGIKEELRESDTEGNVLNLCHMVWNSGEYMFKCRGKNPDITILAESVDSLRIDDRTVENFMIERDTARFADHYFTLMAMKRGDSFEESRDGLTITVFYPIRGINSNDYSKLKEVFSSANNALHTAYMKKLKFPFRNSGCNEEMYAIRPLIEKNVEESTLKNEIISLFDTYRNIMPGEPASTPLLKDTDGKGHTFAEFRGKVLVIDVWATWCSSCLAKMQDFMNLKKRYDNTPGIEFITVSVDRSEARNSWIAAIKKRNMEGMLNLFPDCEEESLFESEYHISGVPRYIIIDEEGKIVTAYAPPPGGGMEEFLKELMKDK